MSRATATRAMVADELDDLVELLRSLRAEEWAVESLCDGWTVHDVVAHLVGWDERLVLGSRARYPAALAGLAATFVRVRLSMDRVNERFVAEGARLAPAKLVDRLDALRGPQARLFDRVTPGVQLAEYVVHHQDIRRPLGRLREVPVERLRASLDAIVRLPGLGVGPRTRGLELRASDLGWTSGAGEFVEGRGEPLLMAMTGRAIGDDELSGPGARRLRGR